MQKQPRLANQLARYVHERTSPSLMKSCGVSTAGTGDARLPVVVCLTLIDGRRVPGACWGAAASVATAAAGVDRCFGDTCAGSPGLVREGGGQKQRAGLDRVHAYSGTASSDTCQTPSGIMLAAIAKAAEQASARDT